MVASLLRRLRGRAKHAGRELEYLKTVISWLDRSYRANDQAESCELKAAELFLTRDLVRLCNSSKEFRFAEEITRQVQREEA